MSSKSLSYDELNETSPDDVESVIFMHGGNSCRLEWRGIADKLAEHYHIIAVDAPGHGQSIEAAPWSLQRSIAMHVDIIRSRAHNSRTHLVGFSTEGTPLSPWLSTWRWKLRLASLQHLPFQTLPKSVHIAGAHFMGMKGMNSNLYDAMKRAGNPMGRRFDDLSDMRLPPASPAKTWQLTTPSLLVAGDKNDDVPTSQALADELALGNSRSHLTVIKGAVHWWGLQYPELFAKLIDDWLSGKDIASQIEPASR